MGADAAGRVRRPDLPTGTVTFLFSDIEGSTRLVQDVGPDVFRTVLERHHAIMRDAFRAHGGVERGTQGDSFAVIFREAPAAVRAAVDAQRSLLAADWPVGTPVRVRIGLHTGLGTAGADDYVGVDIHRAARIAAVAHGGQTVASEATRVLVERHLPAGAFLRDLGRHRLRDLAEPEHLYEISIDGVTPSFPALRVGTTVGNLPVRLTTFIGREAELADLHRLLGSTRLLTLTGPGGIGKTSLAVELARRSAEEYRDGAWLVRLESVHDPGLVAGSIVDGLGVRDAGGRSHHRRLVDHLADRDLLLVLDNMEQLTAAGPEIAAILEAAPGVRVVVTSRSPLRIAGEQAYPVAPLSVGDSDADAGESPAVRLFVERANRARPGSGTGDDRATIAAICRRLDGLPLGIELAAASGRLLPSRTILERLDRRLDLPGGGPADLPPRQRTLRDTIAWSHELLDEPARRLFARLSVFVGGSRLDEAEVVAGAPDELAIDPLGGIAQLVDQSLVVPSAGIDGPRFAMLDTIRTFAQDRLAASGEERDIRRRHALAYLDLAEREAAHLPGREQATRLARLTEDHDNLRAAVACAIETGDADVGLRFAAALWRFWQLRGHLDEGDSLASALLAIPGAARDDELRMRAVEAAAGISYWRGDQERATALYEEQLRMATAVGDRLGQADAYFNLCHVHFVAMGRDPAGRERAERALAAAAALYGELGDARGLARTEWGRWQAAYMLGRAQPAAVADARVLLLACLRRFEELDDYLYAQITTGSLSWANLALGNLEEAVPWAGRALRMSWEGGDVAGTTFELRAVAVLAAAFGQDVEGATLVGAFDEYTRRFAVRPPLAIEIMVSRDDTEHVLRSRLAEADYDRATEAGRAMSLDEAVDFALRALDSMPAVVAP